MRTTPGKQIDEYAKIGRSDDFFGGMGWLG